MGKVNIWLKRSFIVVASLMAIVGALMLAGTLFSHGQYHADEKIEEMIVGINAMYAMSITILVLPIIGLYGVCKEKRWVLIVFTVGIILCSLFVLYVAIHVLIVRPVIIKLMSKFYLSMQPINSTSEMDVKILTETQIELECCGVQRGYVEWGYNISESCLCKGAVEDCLFTNPGVVIYVAGGRPRNSSLFQPAEGTPVMIYKEPCLPKLISHLNVAINTMVGVSMGLTSLWVLSCVLSIAILCQLREKKDMLVVAYSREAKTGNYAVLAEPAELT